MKPQARALRLPNPMIAVVWLAVFIPGHLYDWWVERAFAAVVFLVGGFVLLAKPSPWETRAPARRASLFFFAVQFLYVFSYVYSVAFNGVETGSRDVFELARFLFLWAFVVYVIRHYDDRVRKATENASVAALYFGLVVLFCFERQVPGLTALLRDWLYANTKTSVGAYGTRLAAPFENPNFLGFFAVQTLTYLIFFSKSSLRLAHCAAAMLVIFFTGSRTAWAATALVLAAGLSVYAYQSALKVRLRSAVQLSLALFIALLAGARYSRTILESRRVQRVLEAAHKGGIQNESNAAGRIDQAREALDYVARSPVFGWGPSKYLASFYVDDQYLLWMMRLGLLGFSVILAGLFSAAWRLVASQRDRPLAFVGSAAFVAAVAVMLVAGEFFDNFRLFFMTWFFGAAMARSRR